MNGAEHAERVFAEEREMDDGADRIEHQECDRAKDDDEQDLARVWAR
jgi:hypothetical protein